MSGDLATAWGALRMQIEAHRPERLGESTPRSGVTPVCLLTGFLGAGKSTLLADLLSDPPEGMGIKAIVNDVGELAFDPTLIDSADDVRVELTNGCGCCERTVELAATLRELADDPTCDLIVFEGSGGADPINLAHLVEADPSLRLDRIVTVVSASLLGAAPSLGLPPIVERQIESAHCVVLSQCDLVSDSEADAAFAYAAEIAPGRVITRSRLETTAASVLLPGTPRGARPRVLDPAIADHDFVVVTLCPSGDVTRSELVEILNNSRPGLVRVKGRIMIDGQPHFLQLTPDSTTITNSSPGPVSLTLIAQKESNLDPLIQILLPPTTPSGESASQGEDQS